MEQSTMMCFPTQRMAPRKLVVDSLMLTEIGMRSKHARNRNWSMRCMKRALEKAVFKSWGKLWQEFRRAMVRGCVSQRIGEKLPRNSCASCFGRPAAMSRTCLSCPSLPGWTPIMKRLKSGQGKSQSNDRVIPCPNQPKTFSDKPSD